MGLESAVTLFPRDPAHTLAGTDLALFLDRVAERLIALNDGAKARIRAGRFDAEATTLTDLLDMTRAALEQARGREDLEVRLWGPPRDAFGRYLGTRHLELKLNTFVQPHPLTDARLCACTPPRPLDFHGYNKEYVCSRGDCEEAGDPEAGELHTSWWLRVFGSGPDGIGERFVEEGRRIEGSPFFESLEGVSRARLFEWHTWS